ncbi:LOW QUALITY PROTEIN: hypothetical protein HJC23_005207 [Cyclotella cryptica]|uniref:Uncharacterized protein n=1 Tax=Cyclotella cryptica TaxID=29204 RepID=A0ABD3P3S4_9STRA
MWKNLLFILALRSRNHRARAYAPLALHHLYEVGQEDEIVISLRGHDLDGDETVATITRLPTMGTLYQLSQIFNVHGYDPKAGTPINTTPTKVTGKKSRVVYRRPIIDLDILSGMIIRDADEFEYTVNDGSDESLAGTVTLVMDSSRQLVSSDFRFSDEGWSTVGNKASQVQYEGVSRGELKKYIYAADDLIDVDNEKNDRRLWKFLLPEKFTGWFGSWYGGTFEFTLSSFGSDCSGANNHWVDETFRPLNLVEIYCKSCDLFKGATIGFPLSATDGFDGQLTNFTISMNETSGWRKDPQNILYEWTTPTKCSFIEVLSGITSVKILGDFTNWYETIGIDNVRWIAAPSKGRYHLPICAQDSPDCRACSC